MIGNITAKCRGVVEFEKTHFDRKTHRSQILSMRSKDIMFVYHEAAFKHNVYDALFWVYRGVFTIIQISVL